MLGLCVSKNCEIWRQQCDEKNDWPKVTVFERIRSEKLWPGLVLKVTPEAELEGQREAQPEEANQETLRNCDALLPAHKDIGDYCHTYAKQHAAQNQAACSTKRGNENYLS